MTSQRRVTPLRTMATAVIMTAVAVVALMSCSTGIESTGKIKLSKSEQKEAAPTAEERFLESVKPSNIREWKNGKPFLVLDPRVSVVLTPISAQAIANDSLPSGTILHYEGFDMVQGTDGYFVTHLIFSDGDRKFSYNTSRKSRDDATAADISSDELPMLIDPTIISSVKGLMQDMELWTMTRNWYSLEAAPVKGEKFVPVKVVDVLPGDKVFPLEVVFTTTADTTRYALMLNLGESGLRSRTFASQFSLSDPRKKYPKIDDATWELIRRGQVRAGMTRDECRLSLGSPVSADEQPGYSNLYEIWTYPAGVVLYFSDGILASYR